MTLDPRLIIRFAEPGDEQTILRFIRELAEYERLLDEVVATEERVQDALFGESPGIEALLAFWEEEPTGMALFFHNFSTFHGRKGIYLEDLFVTPAKRGLGIGQALLKRLAGIAVERECARLEWAVLDWNEPAIGFYEALGSVPMNEWTVYRLTGAPLLRLASGE